MRLHRLRVLLRATAAISVQPYQAAEIYALVAGAFGKERSREHAIPDGWMCDCPERARTVVARGERFAFGGTILGRDDREAGQLARALRSGLTQLGRKRTAGAIFGGNFEVEELRDLIVDRAQEAKDDPKPLPTAHVLEELDRLRARKRVTLRWLTPLRAKLPQPRRRAGHAFFDEDTFDGEILIRRLLVRLQQVGAPLHLAEADLDPVHMPRVADNRLHWLDLRFGPRANQKVLGGSVGRVVLDVEDARLLEPLVWGQYARIGESTRFGFGEYRIEELGPAPFACARSDSLIELLLAGKAARERIDTVAQVENLGSGVLVNACDEVRRGDYQPEPHRTIAIPRSDGTPRELSIPTPRDRALQRLVHEGLAPALDGFFELSAFAYRKGLCRRRAALAIRDAFAAGYRFGLRADFRRFFDSIDQSLLRERLDAYVADDALVALIMAWVRTGTGAAQRGVPTGAPISPLLANLFLDRFDEDVARDGARLVRYADDFLILVQNEQHAARMFDAAQEHAEALLLALNEQKTARIGPHESFDFLGYRFTWRSEWRADARGGPRRIEDLGWHEARADEAEGPSTLELPGEVLGVERASGAVTIAGPELAAIKVSSGELVFAYTGGSRETSVPLERVRELAVIGTATVSSQALRRLMKHDVRVTFAGDAGGMPWVFEPADAGGDAEALLAQADASRDGARCLAIARSLIVAKLRNHAALAAVTRFGREHELAAELSSYADRAERAATLDELRGFEGAAAARWYSRLASALPKRLDFRTRVAPNARDPVNAMLNFGFTLLYRLQVAGIARAGLAPALGFLHRPSAGHAALASDLQEPFRHVIERAVLAHADSIDPDDFEQPVEGEPLYMKSGARREFVALLHRELARMVARRSETEPGSYREHAHSQARALRRHLLDPAQPFQPFEHPCPST